MRYRKKCCYETARDSIKRECEEQLNARPTYLLLVYLLFIGDGDEGE